ncbi:MAG: polyribonucleotide nucleotidyltransferase [Deltaproteobacteria bacterium]|nr:polyribonucleotide nucleotidyltransferase [Deltaproteobacteria bacterium]MBM4322778.1 polyribonucleotide nucleotidyltransferase [Deltaproteobacteria bacterium]
MVQKLQIDVGGRPFSIETGKLAKQASGSVVVQYGETVVLVTAVSSEEKREGIDFLPLTVNYLEMTYAAGRIPGGFFKREGRPTDREILISRFIDRPLRPLFPKTFQNETQIIATVLSADSDNDPSVLGMIGASAALYISDIPFDVPIAGAKVGRIDGEYVINPSPDELELSDLDLFVAGSEDAIIMVEGSAKEVTEEMILEAILFGHQSLKPVIELQKQLREACGLKKREVDSEKMDESLIEKVKGLTQERLQKAYQITEKAKRHEYLEESLNLALEAFGTEEDLTRKNVKKIFEDLDRKLKRNWILEKKVRIDGRGLRDIRPISCEVGILPRTHGSALFTRGETQVLAVVTFGTSDDEQKINSLMGETYKSFMLHYNFPPFSTGEVSPLRSPSRREIGHGALAERAILPVLPSNEKFPYTIRIVSEVLESNGSSSMATVCGSTLSLMDAGVPIKAPVAGIAMGLILEDGQEAILSDILGDEDHIGDMDFKMAGTAEGVTAIQMDIKIKGISKEVLSHVLQQSREGRLYILGKMRETLSEPRTDLSRHAPRIYTLQVRQEKIRDIIGQGGKNIRSIVDQTGVKIDVDDSGTVKLASPNYESVEKAIQIIKRLTAEVEVGGLYTGKVKRIMGFGAIVEILPGTDGLVHISQLADYHVKEVTDILKEGDEVQVKVIDVDPQGRIRLSRKAALKETAQTKG